MSSAFWCQTVNSGSSAALSPPRIIRIFSSRAVIASICSSGLSAKSSIISRASAFLSRGGSQNWMTWGTRGGVSIICILMFSNSIIPGVALWVVKGYSAAGGEALVTVATSWDLPALGRPMTATWAAPSFSITIDARRVPLFLAACWVSLAILVLSSARRWSVPLCLGMMASISSRAAIFSSGSLASRKFFSASK